MKLTPDYRECSRCRKDISDLHYQAEICEECRDWNKKRADRDYHWAHKEQLNAQCRDHYWKNREGILEYGKKQRRYRRFRNNTIEVVVAVTCVICEDVIIGNNGKRMCDACKEKWDGRVPKYIIAKINSYSSFDKLPKDLLSWKRIIDLHHERIYNLRSLLSSTI